MACHIFSSLHDLKIPSAQTSVCSSDDQMRVFSGGDTSTFHQRFYPRASYLSHKPRSLLPTIRLTDGTTTRATSCPSHAPSVITAPTTNIRTQVRVYMRIGNRVAQMGFAARVGGAVRLEVWREGYGFCRLITHLRCSLANRARARPIGE